VRIAAAVLVMCGRLLNAASASKLLITSLHVYALYILSAKGSSARGKTKSLTSSGFQAAIFTATAIELVGHYVAGGLSVDRLATVLHVCSAMVTCVLNTDTDDSLIGRGLSAMCSVSGSPCETQGAACQARPPRRCAARELADPSVSPSCAPPCAQPLPVTTNFLSVRIVHVTTALAAVGLLRPGHCRAGGHAAVYLPQPVPQQPPRWRGGRRAAVTAASAAFVR
jgi:hypothetical protein